MERPFDGAYLVFKLEEGKLLFEIYKSGLVRDDGLEQQAANVSEGNSKQFEFALTEVTDLCS